MLPQVIGQAIADFFRSRDGSAFPLKNAIPLSGGCINQAFRLESRHDDIFLKYNHQASFPGMFEAEARGLKLLRDSREIRVPEPFFTATAGTYTLILMEYLHPGNGKPGHWEDFGSKLARLHRHTQAFFGLDHDNYIGSLSQGNKTHADWLSFFIEERLEPQLKLGIDQARFPRELARAFEVFFPRLGDLLPVEPPALLHGDLWSGNFLTAANGEACLFDPAVYYGHREMDLAMTRLFGGFTETFYDAYHATYPLVPGWKERIDIHNLYPLLVHANLFGGGYLRSVKATLKHYSA